MMNFVGDASLGDLFAGSSSVTLTRRGRYRTDPAGSFDPGGNCSGSPFGPVPTNPGVPGYEVPNTHVEEDGTSGNTVHCEGDGVFSRIQNTAKVEGAHISYRALRSLQFH